MIKKLTVTSLMSVLLASTASAAFAAETETVTAVEDSSTPYQLSSITWWWQ